MISSMTGYGRGEVSENRMTVLAEIRTVNSRFLEFSTKLPRSIALRENDIKELTRSKVVRGKVNISVSIERENSNDIPVKVNLSAAKAYRALLETLRKESAVQGEITLDHLLKFSEVLEVDEFDAGDEKEWAVVQRAILAALEETCKMRRREGGELLKDLNGRIGIIEDRLRIVEDLARQRVPEQRRRMEERMKELLGDPSVIDERRLEMELTLFADKLDITEECVRFRSHNKFFLDAMHSQEAAGRKLNFLVQEMNREANTIGAKANDPTISHTVVEIKEELEKIREQLQNIE